MKTRKTLCVLLVLLASYTTMAQTIDPDGEWRVDYQMVWFPIEFYNNLYRDFIDGDTVINSIEYFKVYNSGYSYYGLFPVGELYYYDHVLHGFLREENNKWYTFYENQDTLLFDFTLDVNDTVYSAYTYDFGEPIIVTAIDSILVDGQYRKRLILNGLGAEYIIEGIGASSGLFEQMFFFEWYSELVCYAKNGISVWGDSTEECDLAVRINENTGKPGTFSVFPNPAQDYTMLSVSAHFGKVSFTLIDLIGRIVYQESFQGPSTNKILLTSYHSGVYFGILESNGWKQSVKLIIE